MPLELKKENKNWHLLEFTAPITESALVNDEFIIKGTAITETTTRNNHKYIAEELEHAAPGLEGKPMLVDHNNTVESIKGRVIKSYFDPSSRSIKFESKVMDKNIREMIRDGRLSNVSIGAFATDLVKEEETGAYIAKGLQIAELSFVAVPADENVDFAMALQGNYNIKESMSRETLRDNVSIPTNVQEEMQKCSECNKMIPKDKMKKHMEEMHPDKKMSGEKGDTYTDERRYGEMTEETNSQLQEALTEKAKLLEEVTALRNEKRQNKVSEYKRLCSEKRVTEKDISKASDETIDFLIEQIKEIKVEAEKKEMKSVVAESKTIEGIDRFMIERSENGRGFAVWEMPDSGKLLSLHRSGRLR